MSVVSDLVGGFAYAVALLLLLFSHVLAALAWVMQLCPGSERPRRSAAAAKDERLPYSSILFEAEDGGFTEILSWPGGGAPHRRLVADVLIFFSGNPGAPRFYAPLFSELHARAGGALSIYVVGHAGHSVAAVAAAESAAAAATASTSRWPCVGGICRRRRQPCAAPAARAELDLAAQIRGHRRFVSEFVAAAHPRATLALGGHSVGAHVAVACAGAARAAGLRPTRLLLLFPTLAHIGTTRNGVRLSPLFAHGRRAVAAATAALIALPAALRHAALVRICPPAAMAPGGGAVLAALADLLHPDVASAALSMAAAEMVDIAALPREHAAEIEALGAGSVLYFGRDDAWVDASADALHARFRRATVVRCSEGHVHAFCLHAASSRRIAERCAEWLGVDGGGG